MWCLICISVAWSAFSVCFLIACILFLLVTITTLYHYIIVVEIDRYRDGTVTTTHDDMVIM